MAAAFASGWAALTSYLPVAMVLGAAQFMEDSGSVSGAARSGLAGWLLGHGVPLRTADGPLGLAPLALGMLAAWRLVRAGVHVSRAVGARGARSPRRALAVAVAVGAGYGIIGGIAALVVGTTAVSVWRAALTLAVFGAAAGSLGALRAFRALDVLARRTPAVLRSGVRTGVVAALLLLAAGAGVTGLAVATGGGEASEMIGAYRTGVAGQTGITLVSLGYAPNAAVWAAAYLLGPGFAVGTGTVVRASEVSLGALPALPVLAGLPDGPLSGVAAALLGVPVLAGMVAGWLLARRVRRSAGRVSTGWVPLLATAAVSGPVAGALLGVAAMLSGGPLGDGRLAVIGPDSLRVCLTATLVVGAGAVVGAAATRGLAGPDHH